MSKIANLFWSVVMGYLFKKADSKAVLVDTMYVEKNTHPTNLASRSFDSLAVDEAPYKCRQRLSMEYVSFYNMGKIVGWEALIIGLLLYPHNGGLYGPLDRRVVVTSKELKSRGLNYEKFERRVSVIRQKNKGRLSDLKLVRAVTYTWGWSDQKFDQCEGDYADEAEIEMMIEARNMMNAYMEASRPQHGFAISIASASVFHSRVGVETDASAGMSCGTSAFK